MYTTCNFKTKKALREAVQAGEEVGVYQPGPFGRGVEREGHFCCEGPHYPAAHSWYASVVVKEGKVVSVK